MNPLTTGGAGEPAASAAKGSGVAGASKDAEPRILVTVAWLDMETVMKPMAGAMTALVLPSRPAEPASKSKAGGPDTWQQRKRTAELDPTMVAVPSFFPKARKPGLDVPEEL